ncbi:MAG TPA: TonB-dependent receptor [Polyangiaceae bacterium]|nr:TonB-dependent receptor [Polyangiaceae bacterium]
MTRKLAAAAWTLAAVLTSRHAFAQAPAVTSTEPTVAEPTAAVAPVAKASAAEDDTDDDFDLMRLLNVEVSTATKTSESIEDAPAVITVVTRADIRRWGYRDVADVLQHTVGFYAIDDHILPNVGVRGMTGGLGAESGVIKVMIDGRTVAYRTTSGNWLGIELIPLEAIEQIEIIRGPASALYGADAFLGVVNIITVKSADVRPLSIGLAPLFTPGSPGGRFDALGGTTFGPFDFMLGASGEDVDRSSLSFPEQSPAGRFPSWVGQRRTALDLQRRSLVVQGRLGYEVPRKGRLSLSAFVSGIERGGDFAHWSQLTNDTVNGQRVGTTIGLVQSRLDLDGLYHAAKWLDFALAGSFALGGLLPSDRIEVGSDLFYVERDQSYRTVDGSFEARFIPSARFNFIAGLEASFDHEELLAPQRIERATGREVDVGSAGGKQADLSNIGAYLSSNFKLFDPWLKLTGGVRLDQHSQYGQQLSGRAGIVSRFTRELTLKLLYGNAFKAPSPYLLYATPLQPGDVIGNPALLPQHVHTAEAQVSLHASRFLGITSGVSHSWLLEKAEFTPQGINQAARNVASQRSLAWESRVDLRYYEDYNFYGSFELVQSQRDLGQEGYAASLVGTGNVAYPRWIARGGAMLSIPSPVQFPLQAGAEVIVVGSRRATDASIVERGASYDLPRYVLLDATLATRELYLIRGHESRLALRGKNVLGVAGPDPGFSGFEYPLRPTELILELRHSL